jgi:hypothetical protein
MDISTALSILPDHKAPEGLSDRYMFLDTKQVIKDMADLGFAIAGFRRPETRTARGPYGVHEIDFRRPEDISRPKGEAPRILFINSYDGTRRAQLVSGVIRFICSNGLVTGDLLESKKFLHIGNYADELIKQIQESAKTASRVFESIEKWKEIKLDEGTYLQMAEQAAKLRYPNDEVLVEPSMILQPRRRDDLAQDLFTQWNVIQENLVRGGIPGAWRNGQERTISQVKNIEKSNKLNAQLWKLGEEFADLATH